MAFDWTWLTEADTAPEAYRETADLLRRFLDDADFATLAPAVATRSEDALRALIEVLVERRDGTRLAHLREAAGLPKAARKEVGKAVHRMKTLGVACEVTEGTVGTLAYVPDALSSYMALPLSNGVRLLLLADRVGGTLTCAYVATHETDGVEDLSSIHEPSRTRLRRLMDQIEHGASAEGLFFVEADPALVRTRIREAVALHRRLGKPLPHEWGELRALIESGPTLTDHPVRALVASPDPALLERGASLLGAPDPETREYRVGIADRPVPSEAFESELMQRLHNAWESPLVVTEAQRRERLLSEVDRIAEEFFTADIRARSAARLLDTAYVLAQRGRLDEAATVLVTADAVADPTRAVADVPWMRESLRTMVDLDAFARHMETAGPGHTHDHHHHDEPDDGGLIVSG